MRSITFVVDLVGENTMMVVSERDQQTGPPTMQSIEEGIVLQKIKDAVELYFLLCSTSVDS